MVLVVVMAIMMVVKIAGIIVVVMTEIAVLCGDNGDSGY
jgi:hypothetical protein